MATNPYPSNPSTILVVPASGPVVDEPMIAVASIPGEAKASMYSPIMSPFYRAGATIFPQMGEHGTQLVEGVDFIFSNKNYPLSMLGGNGDVYEAIQMLDKRRSGTFYFSYTPVPGFSN